jgi:hypothetical protein
MAEKILALLIAFFGGIALTALFGVKLINLVMRHSPPLRKLLRDALDREDSRHALVGTPTDDPFALGLKVGSEAVFQDSKCELCMDPIDKPHVGVDGAKRWRPCPNQATRTVDSNGHKLRICEEHFQKVERYKRFAGD